MVNISSDNSSTHEKNDTDLFQRCFPRLDNWDKKTIFNIYHTYNSERIRKIAKFTSILGDPRLWGPTFLLLGIFGLIKLDFTYFIIFFTGFFQSYTIYYIFKNTFKRNRPFVHFEEINRLDKTGHGYSFPSGHSHHSAILLGLLWLSFFPSPWILLLIIPFNLTIAWSRLISVCHFPSDTIIGIILAYCNLFIFWFVTKNLYLSIYQFFIGIIL